MIISVNKQEFDIPFDPDIIRLQDYIDYQNQFGFETEKKFESINSFEFEDEEDKIIAIDNLLDEEAINWVSFWTKKDLNTLKGTKSILPLIDAYKRKRYLLKSYEDGFDLTKTINWRLEDWKIQNYVVDPNSEMTFHEIIASKETVRQVSKLGAGKWTALYYLSVIFFRKLNEEFTEDLIKPGSERLELMRELPLSFAVGVSFFLRISVNFWNLTLAYSKEQAA